MRKFLLKFAVYLIPLPVYLSLVLLIDPFNYAGVSSWISDVNKVSTSYKLNPELWKMIEFKKEISARIILGDSRSAKVEADNLKKLTGQTYYNFSFPGGTLVDMLETFWYADSLTDLEEVYIGINFNLYNDYEKNNHITQVNSITDNFFSYSFSKIVFNAMIQNVKKQFFTKDLQIGRPDMSFDEFWSYQIDVIGKRYYQKYKHPDGYYDGLVKIAEYCKAKNIKLVIFIPPNHIEWQHRMADFNLHKEQQVFLNEMAMLGTLYNMDLDNEFTRNKKNFLDPVHTVNDSIFLHTVWSSTLSKK